MRPPIHRLSTDIYSLEGIEVLPIENAAFASHELGVADEFSAQHRAPDGVGWTESYCRDSPPYPLAGLSISPTRFRELLSPIARQYHDISVQDEYPGWVGGNETYLGFGQTSNAGVIAAIDGEVLVAIHCLLPGSSPDENTVLANLLQAMNSDHELILVDWNMGAVIPLGQREAVDRYLATNLNLLSQPQESPRPETALDTKSLGGPPLLHSAAGMPGQVGLGTRLLRFLLRPWR